MHSDKTKLTCVPSRVDPDHWVFEPADEALASPPAAVELRGATAAFPAIYDQGHLNSCTANAVAAALYYDMRRQQMDSPFAPSRLFIYYNERDREGTIGLDVQHGRPVQMIDCIETVHVNGICPEELWPYDMERFDQRPAAVAYEIAGQYRSQSYYRVVHDLAHLKASLAEGYPVLFGMRVFASFLGAEVARTGVVPMPSPGEQIAGGHALLAVGYDDSRRSFIVRNSFGQDWGQDGHCLLPYDYMMNADLTFDHWVIEHVNTDAGSRRDPRRRARDLAGS